MLKPSMTLKELAGVISGVLDTAGIEAVLSGGSAVSIYTENRYQSYDLDFVTTARLNLIAEALLPLGFIRESKSRYFRHPDIAWVIEFPPGPLQVGDAIQSSFAIINTEYGKLKILSPTQMVMDRLAAYFYWNDPQSLDQAVWVAEDNDIDWDTLKAWVKNEGQATLFEGFERRLSKHHK